MTAELLRRAADRLDELAEQAPPGPWRNVQHGWCLRSEPSPDKATWRSVADEPNPFAIGWMTTLSPQIAAPLAEWLRAEADLLVTAGWEPWEESTEFDYPPTALARLILGEDQ